MKRTIFFAFLIAFDLCIVHSYSSVVKAKSPLSIKSWGYLLQNVTEEQISNCPFDLVVIEPQLETDSLRIFNKQAVLRMNVIPNSTRKRILLAYLSIGEAENYRPYWQKNWMKKPPDWLGKVNPDWDGNYKVRFWKDQWQQIILKQLESILISEFDGVYLDIVDAWEYWSDIDTFKNKREIRQAGDPIDDEKKASELMLDWLQEIADYARKKSPNNRPGFLIFPQNGERLLDFLNQKNKSRFWNLVDGIGVESVFFHGEKAGNNALNTDRERLTILNSFIARDKLVLSVEYITKPRLISEFFKLADQYSFQPYTSVRELDRFMPQLDRTNP